MRSPLPAVATILACALAGLLIFVPTTHGAKVRILAPKENKHLGIGKAVHVQVKAKGPRFRFYVDGRNRTGKFAKRGRIRTATLLAGRDFRRGNVALVARVGRRFDSRVNTSSFIAMDRDQASVKVKEKQRNLPRSGPFFRVRADRKIWELRAALNGKRIGGEVVEHADEKGFDVPLAPHLGLRYGKNRLVVRVLQQNGEFARHVRVFRARRDRPLAGAGPDQTTGVGEPLVLDARSTKPHNSGALGELSYRWEIVRAPEGSQASIDDPTAISPVLKPDAPGEYVVQLKAAAGDLQADAVVTKRGGTQATLDQATVAVPDEDDPMGVPIQTITSEGDIRIGSRTYRRSGGWVKMLVLGANSLAPVDGDWGPGEQTFETSQSGDLVEAVDNLDENHIVILSGQGNRVQGGLTEQQARDLETAIKGIGGTSATYGPTPNGASDLSPSDQPGGWSVIGHAGLPEGHADQNNFTRQGAVATGAQYSPGFPTDAGLSGSLNGWMQEVDSGAYQYISPEFIQFDSKWTPAPDVPPDPTQNTIKVGDDLYPSSTIQKGAIAMQMLVLGAETPTGRMPVLEQGTYGILHADGSTDFQGIYFLDEALNRWVNAHSPYVSPLIILQDFGSQGCECWPGNSVDWIQDHLPPPGDSWTSWQRNPFPSDPGDLFAVWNTDNVHGFGSVAGNIGKLANVPAHDITANYRRPLYRDNHRDGTQPGSTINRNYGGLTVVASTNMYQWSDTFVEGQGYPDASGNGSNPLLANGRVAGVLRRNEQSQWMLTSSSLGPGWNGTQGQNTGAKAQLDPKALWDLVFHAPTAWPCTPDNPAPCPDRASELAAAHRYFVEQVSPTSGSASLRDLYADWYQTDFPTANLNLPYPGRGADSQGIAQDMYDALQGQLQAEISAVEQVGSGVTRWQSFLTGEVAGDAIIDGIVAKVVSDVQDVESKLATETADADGAGVTADVLHVLSEAIDIGLIASGNPEAVAVVAPALGGLGALVELGDDSYSVNQASNAEGAPKYVPNDVDAIRNDAGQLHTDIQGRYETISNSMMHFGSVFATDWGKLQTAAANFAPAGVWAIPSDASETRMQQSVAISAGTEVYKSVLPLALSQWIIAPRRTDYNGAAALDLPARNYRCQDMNGDSGDLRNPFRDYTSTWAMHSQQWAQDSEAFTHYNIRALKVSDDNMDASYPEDDDSTGIRDDVIGVRHAGTDAPEDLLKPLLAPISPFGSAVPGKTGPFGLTKEEFFGDPGWKILKLICGGTDGL